jgi:hypothetical protein
VFRKPVIVTDLVHQVDQPEPAHRLEQTDPTG